MSKTADRSAAGQGGTLAIHLGENAGYCLDGAPRVWVLPKHDDHGYVGAALFDALSDMWKVLRPDRILLTVQIDDPDDRAPAALQIGLSMCVRVFGIRRSVPVELVHPMTVHQVVFERADLSKRALKTLVTSLAKRRGMTSPDPDAAGALVLYEYSTRLKAAA